MIYNEGLYESELFEGTTYTGTWSNNYSFTYLAGTTVSILPTLTATIPDGTSVKIYAGETTLTYVEIFSGIESPVLFQSLTSGATNIYIKLVLQSTQQDITPIISSLSFVIHQETSLYTIAAQILSDGLLDTGTTYNIDTELQKYLIPYSSFTPVKHRYALKKVAEASGGVVYQDRYGVIQVEAGNFLTRNPELPSLDTINENRILSVSSPISEVKNIIQIKTLPLVALTDQTVYTLSGDNLINNGESRTFDIFYTDYEAVIDGAAVLSSTPAGATIIDETHYSWGATVTVLGSSNGQQLALTIEGKPLVIRGSRLVTRTDGASIRRNGNKTLSILENKLLQSAPLAEQIADSILSITKQEARDIESDWRGDPTLELGDKVTFNGIPAVIVTQEFNFNGALSAKMHLRKV